MRERERERMKQREREGGREGGKEGGREVIVFLHALVAVPSRVSNLTTTSLDGSLFNTATATVTIPSLSLTVYSSSSKPITRAKKKENYAILLLK